MATSVTPRIEDEDPLLALGIQPFAVFRMEDDQYYLRWGKYRLKLEWSCGESVVERICYAMRLVHIQIIANWREKFSRYSAIGVDTGTGLSGRVLKLLDDMASKYKTRVVVFVKTKGCRKVVDIDEGVISVIPQDTFVDDVDHFLLVCDDEVLFTEHAEEL